MRVTPDSRHQKSLSALKYCSLQRAHVDGMWLTNIRRYRIGCVAVSRLFIHCKCFARYQEAIGGEGSIRDP